MQQPYQPVLNPALEGATPLASGLSAAFSKLLNGLGEKHPITCLCQLPVPDELGQSSPRHEQGLCRLRHCQQ